MLNPIFKSDLGAHFIESPLLLWGLDGANSQSRAQEESSTEAEAEKLKLLAQRMCETQIGSKDWDREEEKKLLDWVPE